MQARAALRFPASPRAPSIERRSREDFEGTCPILFLSWFWPGRRLIGTIRDEGWVGRCFGMPPAASQTRPTPLSG